MRLLACSLAQLTGVMARHGLCSQFEDMFDLMDGHHGHIEGSFNCQLGVTLRFSAGPCVYECAVLCFLATRSNPDIACMRPLSDAAAQRLI